MPFRFAPSASASPSVRTSEHTGIWEAQDSSTSSVRQGLLAALIVVMGLLIVGWPLWSYARNAILAATRSEVLQIARGAAALVDIPALQELRRAPAADSPANLRLLTPLVRLHRSLHDVMYLYIAILQDNEIYFLTGTDQIYRVAEDTLPPDPVMTRYTGNDQELRQALVERMEAVNPVPVREAQRSYLSAYAPILDNNGGFLGVVGADMWSASLEQRINSLDTAVGAACMLILLLSTAGGILRFRQHRANQRAARAALRTYMITEHVPILISYIDHDERYRFCNGAFREMLGIPPEQMIGRSVLDVRGAETYRIIAPHLQAALAGTRAQFTARLETRDGPRHLHTEYLPDVAQGRVRGVYAMTMDSTALHELALHSATLERSEALHDLLKQIASSFANKLAVVHGYLESVDAATITPDDLDMMRLSLGDCLGMVEQVQLLAGYSAAAFANITILELMDELMPHLRQEFRSVPINLDIPDGLPPIRGNASLLRSALSEVLANARDASASHGSHVQLRVRAHREPQTPAGIPLIARTTPGACLVIAIADNGRGMVPTVLRRAGDPFFTTRSEHKGLGLALVAGIVRVHSGGAWIESDPQHGTTVSIVLPAV